MRHILIFFVLFQPVAGLSASYHVGSDCAPLPSYHAPADIQATNDTLKPVDLNPSPIANDLKNVPIGLNIPLSNYVAPGSVNADLSRTDLAIGQIDVDTSSGKATLNGHEIAQQPEYPADCGLSGKSIYSTK